MKNEIAEDIEEFTTQFKAMEQTEPMTFRTVTVPNTLGDWIFNEMSRWVMDSNWKGYKMEISFSARMIQHENGRVCAILAPKITLQEICEPQARDSREHSSSPGEVDGTSHLGAHFTTEVSDE